jgi:hypothetical protein
VHLPRGIHNLFFRLSFSVSVYRRASFLQCILVGEVLRGEFGVSAMNGSSTFGVRYQRVIAFPQAMMQLMALQFDFHTFVYGLNYV